MSADERVRLAVREINRAGLGPELMLELGVEMPLDLLAATMKRLTLARPCPTCGVLPGEPCRDQRRGRNERDMVGKHRDRGVVVVAVTRCGGSS